MNFIVRSFGGKMWGSQSWLTLAVISSVLLQSDAIKNHNRRTMPTPTTLPLTKGGWRPVLNSGLPGYGAFAAAPLLAPSYKIPASIDSYPSPSRPIATRDVAKLTSVAQAYRPTTLRSLPASSPTQPQQNQPINSYYNPFAGPNNGLSHYKIVQNFPSENIVIRNPHNPYAARPVYTKYPNKFKQSYHGHNLQQLNNVQPLQFAVPAYQNQKPNNAFVNQYDPYGRPTEAAKKPTTPSGTEIFKPEVYKLPDSDTSLSQQQVKTAQQQQVAPANLKPNQNGYTQYAFQNDKFGPLPPSILGTFNSYGVQSLKGRDPLYPPPTKTTFLPQQPTKQTIFNSFSFSPYFKSTPGYYGVTTPKFQTALNQIHYGTTLSDFKATPTQPPKDSHPPNADQAYGQNFKASPQDPFAKPHDPTKVQSFAYNPNQQTTTASNSYFYNNYQDPYQQNPNYYNQQAFNYDNKKHKIHDSIPSSVNQQPQSQFPDLPLKKPELDATQNSLTVPVTYEVTENYDSDDTTHGQDAWSAIPDTHEHSTKHKATEEAVTQGQVSESSHTKPSLSTDLPEEYAIVTEGEKGYENSLSYDSHVETQSRRPLGDDFEPIGKHKLKDYYYKVSTPSHEEYTTHYKRKHKPTEPTLSTAALEPEVTTYLNKNNDIPLDALPTLPPNKHFKRPSEPEGIDKDRIRKRNKNRRRRPPLANINRDREETSTKQYVQSTEPTLADDTQDNLSVKPRVRIPKPKLQTTTQNIFTDLSTSALPTIAPTAPTIVKKKIGHRRPITTTTDKLEVTTFSYKDFDSNKESPIMKIATRPQHPRVTTTSEIPDYTHKQDEKDTPTSDVTVSITESSKNKPESVKNFSFHRDYKPIEAKLEPIRHSSTTEPIRRDSSEDATEVTTTTPIQTSESTGKLQRPRLKNKYESNRPKFSVKDYRNRLSSTTTTEKASESNTPKLRFPQRRLPYENKYGNENGTEGERKKFIPKDPRHKNNSNDGAEPVSEKELHSTSRPYRQRQTTTEHGDGATQKISSRIRNGSRRKPAEETTENASPTTVHVKRPLRKKIKDSEIGESVQDVTVTETTTHNEHKDDITSERTRSESAIMKIAKDDKKHLLDHIDNIFEHSKRVSDLTLAASKDYNTPGMFKTVSSSSRRIPSYFTIATDDPILPIEAFFPQLNQKKDS